MLLGPLPDQLPEMASPVTPRTVSTEAIRVAMEKVLKDKDLAYVSLSEMRQQVAESLGFGSDGLECRKKEMKKLAKDFVAASQTEQEGDTISQAALATLLAEVESLDARQYVYLITLSRVHEAVLPDGRAYKDPPRP